MYLLVLLVVKYLNIRSFIVLFQRSATEDFSSFSVVYSSTKDLTCLLKNSSTLSTHSKPGFRSLKISFSALATSAPVLVFKGNIQPYFKKTSITVSKYLTPSLSFENACCRNFIDSRDYNSLFGKFLDRRFVQLIC